MTVNLQPVHLQSLFQREEMVLTLMKMISQSYQFNAPEGALSNPNITFVDFINALLPTLMLQLLISLIDEPDPEHQNQRQI